MGKGIYTYYKERLIEIGGKNKCLYLKGVVKKGAYDIGRLFEGRDDKIRELTDFLWSDDKNRSLSLISKSDKNGITETSVSSLTDDGRITELSRILGGINVTDAQRAAAVDMLKEREIYKNN